MTGSIMPCLKKLDGLLLCLVLLLSIGTTQAADIVVENARLIASDEGYSLNADYKVSLNPRLEEAVNKGIALFFTADFELTRSRWYWFDRTVVQHSKTFQLSYHALTRQYRLSSGALHQSFSTLAEALQVLSRLRHWLVIEKGEISEGVDYTADTRLRLDPSQMAKTFQVSALSNRDWNPSSEWRTWSFSVSEAAAPETAGKDGK